VTSLATPHVALEGFAPLGLTAFVTTRAAGTFGLGSGTPDVEGEAAARWSALQAELSAAAVPHLTSARQVHETTVLAHEGAVVPGGLHRHDGADGHLLRGPGALAVTIADCVPVLLAHPEGMVAAVHAGWRGVAGGILGVAIRAMEAAGVAAVDLRMHLGPAICGRCYEVGPDVYERLTGWQTTRPRQVDLRALLAEQAKAAGVRHWAASPECTRCDNAVFYSHRAGDVGRQIAVIARPSA
jgi:YfiH family protein